MMWLADLMLLAAALVGHFSIAVWLFNRLHATAWPRKAIKVLEKLLILAAAVVLALLIVRWFASGPRSTTDVALQIYVVLSWAAALAVLPLWLIPKIRERRPIALRCNDTLLIDIAARLGRRPLAGIETSLLARLPGNEIFRLAVQRKTIALPQLPPALDGLTIAHLSDLHMTGQFSREFYDAVIDETNSLDAELITITGDILEKERCLPWIEQTLGRLRARHGRFFVLGNHEKRLRDVGLLRRALLGAGLTDLGSRWEKRTIRGAEILLAGTELPWFGCAPVLGTEHSVPSTIPSERQRQVPSFRILLSHTPDQLPWAKANGFDLMLAGHNHGGQIRLPYLGALISPSRFGWRYAGGLYHEPPTVLHVSRGVAGIHPIRLNCPPELALLILKSA